MSRYLGGSLMAMMELLRCREHPFSTRRARPNARRRDQARALEIRALEEALFESAR
jgi:hypothetical protein